jgi:hypothetical protein
MLLICPVRPGDTNEELRYALRSWETNLLLPDGMHLMTVGYKPSWLEPDFHVEGNHYRSVALAVFDNVRLGALEAERQGRGKVLFMNDDFFCMDPMESVLPVRRNCTLAEHIAIFPENAGLWWPRSLRLTASWLDRQGFPSPDSYEVHRPLVASAEGMADALTKWDGGMTDTVPQWRTVYGTLNKVDAHPVQDVKLGTRNTGVGTPWLSTSDLSWRQYAGAMKKRFQKPSRWEIT